LYDLCRDICDINFAPVVDPEWLPLLEMYIAHHHRLLKQLSASAFTPKVHFMVHYPRLISMFGPLRHIWCMLSRRLQNFKNFTNSLSDRYQRKKCCQYACGFFNLSSVSVFDKQQYVPVTSFPKHLIDSEILQAHMDNVQSAEC